MNPAFECPTNLSVEDMKGQIEKCNSPCLITDERFRILSQNNRALKAFKVKDGGLFLPFIFPSDYRKFIIMRIGQICRVKLDGKITGFATVTRFKHYYLFLLEPPMESFVQGAVRIKSEADRRVSEVEEFCARMGRDVIADKSGLNLVRNRQLVRKFNSEHMLEMVSEISVRQRESFEPSIDLNRICKFANDELAGKGVIVYGDALSSPFCCSGVKADLYTAVSVMIAVATELSCDGKIRFKGAYSEYKYRVLVDCRPTRTGSADTEKHDEQIEYLNCIAASNGWFVRIFEEEDRTSLVLIMPCNEERTLTVRIPGNYNIEKTWVALQLANVKTQKYRKSKNKTTDFE